MRSTILQTASRYLLPILLLFSIFLLLRGHYNPGGGFVGGLVAAIAFILHSFAHGTVATMKIIVHKPMVLIPVGLGIAAIAMFMPVFFGYPVMTGLWFDEPIPVIGLLGSALLFDLGVYLVVIGVVLTILLTISLYTH